MQLQKAGSSGRASSRCSSNSSNNRNVCKAAAAAAAATAVAAAAVMATATTKEGSGAAAATVVAAAAAAAVTAGQRHWDVEGHCKAIARCRSAAPSPPPSRAEKRVGGEGGAFLHPPPFPFSPFPPFPRAFSLPPSPPQSLTDPTHATPLTPPHHHAAQAAEDALVTSHGGGIGGRRVGEAFADAAGRDVFGALGGSGGGAPASLEARIASRRHFSSR
eukprot:355235-Chlamydomonas_euryale.AAC.3